MLWVPLMCVALLFALAQLFELMLSFERYSGISLFHAIEDIAARFAAFALAAVYCAKRADIYAIVQQERMIARNALISEEDFEQNFYVPE